MNHLSVEELNTKTRNAALSLINDAYSTVHGFRPLTMADLNALAESGFFALASVDGKPVSFACGSMAEIGEGQIHWAGVTEDFRGECFSLPPMQACVNFLRDKGTQRIGVANWLDAPYRQMLGHFELDGIKVEHVHVILRLDVQNYVPQPPQIKAGYDLRTFREGDEQIWADVRNAAFGDSSKADEFWTQTFLGVNNSLDFAPQAYFFAEKGGETIGMSAGIVLRFIEPQR